MVAVLVVAAFALSGCGDELGASGSETSSESSPSSTDTGSSTWEKARRSQDDPDAIKSDEDIAGNCVMDVASGAQICGTAAMDYCVGGLAPPEAQDACTVIVADALTPKD